MVRIKALPGGGTKFRDREVAVSCSCPFWVYWGPDWNAAQGGFSESIRSNGAPPNIRDPQNVNLICKHVYLSGQYTTNFVVTDQDKYKERAKKRQEDRKLKKDIRDRNEVRQEEQEDTPEYLL